MICKIFENMEKKTHCQQTIVSTLVSFSITDVESLSKMHCWQSKSMSKTKYCKFSCLKEIFHWDLSFKEVIQNIHIEQNENKSTKPHSMSYMNFYFKKIKKKWDGSTTINKISGKIIEHKNLHIKTTSHINIYKL